MTDAGVDDADRMTDFEALMWELEKSPLLSNAFSNVTMLDRPPRRDALVARMARATQIVPRLHQRPVTSGGPLANPAWVDDPDFDLEHHLRWVGLGGGATERELHEFVAALGAQPLDRERPLWDFTVVEGLRDGRAAMIQRMHHTITDGEGGIRLSMAFVDLERKPSDPGPADAGPADADTVPGADMADGGVPGDSPSGGAGAEPADGEGNGIGDAARAITETVWRRGSQVVDLLGSTGSFVFHPGDSADLALSASRQLLSLRRYSPLWTDRTAQRWYGTLELDLGEVKDAAHRLGGSVNDLFVTGAATAAAHYHLDRGAPVEELRISMPMSLRHDLPADERGDPMAGGNAITLAQAMVPTGEMPADERFATIHDRLTSTRSERVLTAFDGTAAVIGLLPGTVLLATGERATAGIDFVCSNVRAAPFDLYIAGALMEANYPVGPTGGTAFNLTTMSYRGTLFLGLHVDAGAIAEPDSLREGLVSAYAELMEAARSTG